MTDLQELKEKAGRYKRLSENEDFIKTLDELDIQFGLKRTVFHDIGTLKGQPVSEFLVAKEGARAYSETLRTIADIYENLVKEQGEDDNE